MKKDKLDKAIDKLSDTVEDFRKSVINLIEARKKFEEVLEKIKKIDKKMD